MRVWNAWKVDMRFQYTQGFYGVYVLITILYMVLLSQLPDTVRQMAVPLIVFSDPSVVGFFFIGGIVMLENVQGILGYLAVTPLRSQEYLLSKLLSLSLLAEAAGLVIAKLTYSGAVYWFLLGTGILMSSVFFTLTGFLAAAGCRSMNQYFLRMIPYMLILALPCFSMIGIPFARMWSLIPSVAGLRLVWGAFYGISLGEAVIYIVWMMVCNVLLFLRVQRTFWRISLGGEMQ